MSHRIEIVAELGQTMKGQVQEAVDAVYAFAAAGASHIKVQMLDPETIATADAPSYWQTGPPILQRASFAASGIIGHREWDPVRSACEVVGVGFVATPFDLAAVDALRDLDPTAVKIASGDITYLPLLDAVRGLQRRVFLSTGASTRREITNALLGLAGGPEIVPLACSLAYPTPIAEGQFERIRELQHLMGEGARVGYSDHTPGSHGALYAGLAGAAVLEKHVTLRPGDPSCPDNLMALDPGAFEAYVSQARRASELLGRGLDPTEREAPARAGARRAARFARAMKFGETLGYADISFLRPDPHGDGASIRVATENVGRRLLCPVEEGELIDTPYLFGP